jgi:hypothetical protein
MHFRAERFDKIGVDGHVRTWRYKWNPRVKGHKVVGDSAVVTIWRSETVKPSSIISQKNGAIFKIEGTLLSYRQVDAIPPVPT